MERDIEKDLVQIESAIKSSRERDNMFTTSVLERCFKLVLKLKEYKGLEEQGRLMKIPCREGDTVFDVVLCDDGNYHIFEMKVCAVIPFGEVRKGKVWNVYLEDEHSKAYRSFYDFGKTVFRTQEEAAKKKKEKNHAAGKGRYSG